jgi:hypothetical protein
MKKPEYDPIKANELIGKTVLVGLTREDHSGKFIMDEEFHGKVIRAQPGKGIILLRDDDGTECTLPPDTGNFRVAKPGLYRSRSTGDVVKDPDFLAVWTVREPPPGGWKKE